ncbi:MAG: acyl-CoA dehydrogenase [Candidatus Brocadiales bacterium]
MNFSITEEQRLLSDIVREFAHKELGPIAAELDNEARFPAEQLCRASELGFMGIMIPERYGGSGMDTISYVIALEEISRACASTAVIISVNNSLVCEPIFRFGCEELKHRFLIPLSRGEKLGCFALTEPQAGSDAVGLKTTAIKRAGCYVLNGTKLLITSGDRADVAVVFAVTDRTRGTHGISAFLVEKGTPGFSVGKIEDKMGLRASDLAELSFQDCTVPEENLLGKEGDGFKIAMITLDGGRIGIAAQSVGIARACLEDALRYSKERFQFGQPISGFQAIRFMLADMSVEIEAGRLLTFRAAYLKDRGLPYTKEASQSKLYASEMANRVAYKALQIFGGYGYTKEFPVERWYRDARVTTIYEGTSEIQRLVIARDLLRGTVL